MTPRRARLWHLTALARILWAFTRAAPGGSPRSRLTDLRLLARLIRQGQVRLAGDLAGRPSGFIIRDGERVHALYTDPAARGQGIGGRLLDEAKQSANRLELWTTQCNSRARAFYARHGFREALLTNGQGNDERLPDVKLIWERNAR